MSWVYYLEDFSDLARSLLGGSLSSVARKEISGDE